MSTIYALSSARGRAGVAVIRASGAQALRALETLAGKLPAPRQATLRTLYHPVSRETIDKALVLTFPAPQSFTGENVVEYHVHGGLAVVESLMSALSVCAGHRMAEPGEFTRRAFENGKMDLTEAEGLADLINAETELQKAQAFAQMGGALSRLYQGWSDRLAKLLAHVEADIEFPEEDLSHGISTQCVSGIQALIAEMKMHLNDNRRGERLRDGVQIAVVGAPNAGKSSLVNALAQRDIAIVSDIPGTTRDVLEAHLNIGGYPVILLDTAGLRPDQVSNTAQDSIESEGMRRALARAQAADILLLLYDGTSKTPDPHTFALENLPQAIPVINKADARVTLKHPSNPPRISARTQGGVQALLELLLTKIEALGPRSESPALTRTRHRDAVTAALYALDRSLNATLPELAAEDLRLALRDLGRITGKVDIEDLLDIVFRDFCIGK